jgi:putative SOS response-associated peptidase YedK
MCGRFSLTASAELLRTFFYLLEGAPLLEPRFNIAPSRGSPKRQAGTGTRTRPRITRSCSFKALSTGKAYFF